MLLIMEIVLLLLIFGLCVVWCITKITGLERGDDEEICRSNALFLWNKEMLKVEFGTGTLYMRKIDEQFLADLQDSVIKLRELHRFRDNELMKDKSKLKKIESYMLVVERMEWG